MRTPFASIPILLLSALLSILSGCAEAPKKVAPKPPKPSPQTLMLNQAVALEAAGDFNAAATFYEQLASDSQAPQSDEFWVRAANAHAQANAPELASLALARADRQRLSAPSAFLARLLEAEWRLAAAQAEAAGDLLAAPAPIAASTPLLIRYHGLRADVFRLQGDFLASARELNLLDTLLSAYPQRLDNQVRLLRTLSALSEAELTTLQASQPGRLGGWMDLSLALRPYTEDTQRAQAEFDLWRTLHPEQALLPGLFAAYLKDLQRLSARYRQIAVLLPASGRYASASAAVQDGLMSAYYAAPQAQQAILRFYDTSNTDDIWPLLQQAIADGAEAAIGPLQKEAVQQLAQAGDLPIPVLALNRVKLDNAPPAHFFQFGLAPEDEAWQAAEKAWRDGASQALALIPDTDWGHRLRESFQERWEALGGVLLEYQTYDPALNDFTGPIRALLNLDDSQQREQDLTRVLGQSLEFQPRRRQDAQALFLAANAAKARALWPQLQFHRANDLPTYSTSHVYSGQFETPRDLDLVGLMFSDIPWVLNPGAASEELPEEIHQRRGSLARLYALGMDSYRLLAELPRLKEFPSSSIAGGTGELTLDELNQIHRQLLWARISAEGIELIDPPTPADGLTPTQEPPPETETAKATPAAKLNDKPADVSTR